MMVTEGGTGKKTEWRHIRYFSYESLRKRWQKVLLGIYSRRSKGKLVEALEIYSITRGITYGRINPTLR